VIAYIAHITIVTVKSHKMFTCVLMNE